MSAAAAVLTQAGAEVRMRLRSGATLAAVLAIAAGTWFWLPSARGRAVSISWKNAAGETVAPLYTSGTVGVSVTVFAAIFLTLAGFYLVAGSVRRDRERGVGAILAATPLSNEAYLLGKFAANLGYLSVLAALMLGIGALRFAAEGVGPFRPFAFAAPLLLMAGPALVFVAAATVLFDVAPVLRGRFGLVAWFFTFMIVTVLASVPRHAENGRLRAARVPAFDPTGVATLEQLVVDSVPDARKESFSAGHLVLDRAPARVPWRGIRVTSAVVGARLMNLLWGMPPLFAAFLLFDRFDPARRRRSRTPRARTAASSAAVDEAPLAPSPSYAGLSGERPAPSALRAIAAEALLVWQTAPVVKWLLPAAALTALALPESALTGIAAAWLVLLVPIVSEAAAREEQSGAAGLVFSQPGIPRSAALWKAASLALFLAVAGLPFLVRFALLSPARAIAWLTGLLFVAGFAAGAGWLTRGGKLFSGILLALWYAALSGVRDADFCGIAGGATGAPARALYLAVGGAFVGAAMLRESAARRA